MIKLTEIIGGSLTKGNSFIIVLGSINSKGSFDKLKVFFLLLLIHLHSLNKNLFLIAFYLFIELKILTVGKLDHTK